MESWFFYALIYPLAYSIGNSIDKFLLEKKVKNLYAYSVLVGAILFISALIVAYFVDLPVLNFKMLFFACLSGITFGVVCLIYYHLLTYQELSRVIGIGYLFPAFVALYSRIFLGEQLQPIKYFAIGIAILGSVILSVENDKTKLKLTHAIWIMLLNAALLGVVDTSDKYVLGFANYWQAYILTTIPMALVLCTPILIKQIRKSIHYEFRNISKILLVESLSITAALSFLKAASIAPITLVSAVGILQPVFVLIITLLLSIFKPHLIKERINFANLVYKIPGIILIVLGAAILNF